MHFGLREIAASISAAALIFCCSCEKHHLGEDPEAQKENVDEAKGGEEPTSVFIEVSPRPKPTPAQFFPENTPSP
jgi:hypothetical protein